MSAEIFGGGFEEAGGTTGSHYPALANVEEKNLKVECRILLRACWLRRRRGELSDNTSGHRPEGERRDRERQKGGGEMRRTEGDVWAELGRAGGGGKERAMKVPSISTNIFVTHMSSTQSITHVGSEFEMDLEYFILSQTECYIGSSQGSFCAIVKFFLMKERARIRAEEQRGLSAGDSADDDDGAEYATTPPSAYGTARAMVGYSGAQRDARAPPAAFHAHFYALEWCMNRANVLPLPVAFPSIAALLNNNAMAMGGHSPTQSDSGCSELCHDPIHGGRAHGGKRSLFSRARADENLLVIFQAFESSTWWAGS
ncbi:hypothetical protein C8J57DRAFT_1679976 [Mycena rebaudengoi]|nr:hypothetical protein C8J57DRAFT_1679976 [Mycena rebaudengoi]